MLNSPIDEIKSRLDIIDVVQSYVRLQKTGANFRARCPFHSEKTPSFFVSPSRQIFKCFGCGQGGGIFDFVMKMEGMEFGDALRILAQKAGVELKRQDPKLQTERQRLLEICELACKFYERHLESSENGKKAKEYLFSRGISGESIKSWRIGFSPDAWRGLLGFLTERGYKGVEIVKAGLAIEKEGSDFRVDPRNYPRESASTAYDRFRGRIMFPIFDLNGQAVGFGGRVFLTQKEGVETSALRQQSEAVSAPKYINTPQTLIYDKSRILYGLNRAKVDIRQKNQAVLVEGYTDVIMSHQAGIENVVATSGTALTSFQLQIIKRYTENLLICFDMDVAGDTATRRGIDMAIQGGFNVKIVTFDNLGGFKKDPADLIGEDPLKWQEAISAPKGILDFYFERTFLKYDSKTPDGKREIGKIILPVLKMIPSKIEQSHWISQLALRLGAREEDILEDLKKIQVHDPERYYDENEKGKSISQEHIKKSRRLILEERVLALAMRDPKRTLDCIGGFEPSCCETKEVLENLKIQTAAAHDFNPVAFQTTLPAHLASYCDNLFLEEEFIGALDQLDVQKEINFCLRQIKILDIRRKLQELESEIRQLESEGKLEDNIFDEFSRLSQELMMLEAAK